MLQLGRLASSRVRLRPKRLCNASAGSSFGFLSCPKVAFERRKCYKFPMRAIDLSGKIFGRWAATGSVTVINKERHYFCRCACGTERLVSARSLRTGASVSCGCFKDERASECNRTHGMTGTPIYMRWAGMMQRCYNKNGWDYKYYGGEGKTVCERWHSFEGFLADMGATFRPELTLERIDHKRGYEPGNCTWIPGSDQAKNRRPSSEWDFKKWCRKAAT